jgi:hypothetical protein
MKARVSLLLALASVAMVLLITSPDPGAHEFVHESDVAQDETVAHHQRAHEWDTEVQKAMNLATTSLNGVDLDSIAERAARKATGSHDAVVHAMSLMQVPIADVAPHAELSRASTEVATIEEAEAHASERAREMARTLVERKRKAKEATQRAVQVALSGDVEAAERAANDAIKAEQEKEALVTLMSTHAATRHQNELKVRDVRQQLQKLKTAMATEAAAKRAAVPQEAFLEQPQPEQAPRMSGADPRQNRDVPGIRQMSGSDPRQSRDIPGVRQTVTAVPQVVTQQQSPQDHAMLSALEARMHTMEESLVKVVGEGQAASKVSGELAEVKAQLAAANAKVAAMKKEKASAQEAKKELRGVKAQLAAMKKKQAQTVATERKAARAAVKAAVKDEKAQSAILLEKMKKQAMETALAVARKLAKSTAAQKVKQSLKEHKKQVDQVTLLLEHSERNEESRMQKRRDEKASKKAAQRASLLAAQERVRTRAAARARAEDALLAHEESQQRKMLAKAASLIQSKAVAAARKAARAENAQAASLAHQAMARMKHLEEAEAAAERKVEQARRGQQALQKVIIEEAAESRTRADKLSSKAAHVGRMVTLQMANATATEVNLERSRAAQAVAKALKKEKRALGVAHKLKARLAVQLARAKKLNEHTSRHSKAVLRRAKKMMKRAAAKRRATKKAAEAEVAAARKKLREKEEDAQIEKAALTKAFEKKLKDKSLKAIQQRSTEHRKERKAVKAVKAVKKKTSRKLKAASQAVKAATQAMLQAKKMEQHAEVVEQEEGVAVGLVAEKVKVPVKASVARLVQDVGDAEAEVKSAAEAMRPKAGRKRGSMHSHRKPKKVADTPLQMLIQELGVDKDILKEDDE